MQSKGSPVSPETNVGVHLSIWRDYSPPHKVALHGGQAGGRAVTPEHGMQAEVYSWQLRMDLWACIADEEVRRRLVDKLMKPLKVSLPPAERPLAVLGDFIAAAEQAIASGAAGPVAVTDGGSAALMNPLLALVLHLKWLIRCFADRPGISVST